MTTSVKSRVDEVRRRAIVISDFGLPLSKARNVFSHVLYGMSYRASLAAEKAGTNLVFAPTRARAASEALKSGVEFSILWSAIAASFDLHRPSDTWCCLDVMNAVASEAGQFNILLESSQLLDAISLACFARPYDEVVEAEADGKLEPLRLPPHFLKLASDQYGIDAHAFRLAFSYGEVIFHTDDIDREPNADFPSMSNEDFEWCRERYAVGELSQLSSNDAYYFITELDDRHHRAEAEAIVSAAEGLRTECHFLDALAEMNPTGERQWTELKMRAYTLGYRPAGDDIAQDFFVQRQFEAALDLAVTLAAEGSKMSAELAGYMYETGAGIPLDTLEAARWYAYGATLEDGGSVGEGPDIVTTDGIWTDEDAIEELSAPLNDLERQQVLKIVADWASNKPGRLLKRIN